MDEVAGRLDADVRGQLLATDAEVDSLRRYQATDRTYELVSDVLRGTSPTTTSTVSKPASLPRASQRSMISPRDGPTPRHCCCTVDSEASTEPSVILPRSVTSSRSTPSCPPSSTDMSRSRSSQNRQEQRPVLLEIAAPVGTRALWVPPVGDWALAYQGELILPRRTRLRIEAVGATVGSLGVNCEVLLS